MRLKYFFISLLTVLLLGVSALFVAGKYYDKEVKLFFLNQLNQKLKTPIKAGEIKLSLISNFPNASIHFEKLIIADVFSKKQRDTLLFCDDLSLSFNVWDIWKGNYKITQAEIEGGVFNLRYNRKGESNLDIWRSSGASNDPFQLKLKQLKLNNLLFRLTEPNTQQELKAFVKNSSFSGNFSSKQFTLTSELNTRVYSYSIKKIEYVNQKDVKLNTQLGIDLDRQLIAFKQVELALNALYLDVKGNVNFGPKSHLDLDISGKDIKLTDLIAGIPEIGKKKMESYESSGNISLKAKLKGQTHKGNLPKLSIQFSINNGNLTEKESQISLNNLRLKGSYHTGFTGTDDSLQLNQCQGIFGPGSFQISGTLYNFTQPKISSKLKGNLSLPELSRFVKWQGADSINGNLQFDLNIQGSIALNEKIGTQFAQQISTNGNLFVQNGEFKIKGAKNRIQNVKAFVHLSGNAARIDQFTFSTGNSDFKLNGLLFNLIPYIFVPNENLNIEARLISQKIDLSDFITEQSQSTSDARINLPKNISGHLSANIQQLQYRNFNANHLSGRLSIDQNSLKAEVLNFKSCGGAISTNAQLIELPNSYQLKLDATVNQCDLKQIFSQFENFGQNVVTDKELSGIANAYINLSTELNPQLQTIAESIVSELDISIKNGQLNDLKVLKDLSQFLRNNTAFNAVVNVNKLDQRLKRVEFSTLSNTISIRNKKIFIPEMNIQSSALDLKVSGVHGFDNSIDYSLNFRMAELFRKNQETEFGYIIDEPTGMRMFIAIGGTVDQPTFRFDKQAAAESRKQKWDQEKKEIKKALRDEIGLFKGDSSLLQGTSKQKNAVKFELDFGNQNSEKPAVKTSKPNAQTETKKPETEKNKAKKNKELDTKEYQLDDDL